MVRSGWMRMVLLGLVKCGWIHQFRKSKGINDTRRARVTMTPGSDVDTDIWPHVMLCRIISSSPVEKELVWLHVLIGLQSPPTPARYSVLTWRTLLLSSRRTSGPASCITSPLWINKLKKKCQSHYRKLSYHHEIALLLFSTHTHTHTHTHTTGPHCNG